MRNVFFFLLQETLDHSFVLYFAGRSCGRLNTCLDHVQGRGNIGSQRAGGYARAECVIERRFVSLGIWFTLFFLFKNDLNQFNSFIHKNKRVF